MSSTISIDDRIVPVPYKLRRIRRLVGKGVTQASYCDLAAILKVDTAESQYAVYNELVAVRLAQAAGLPVADGILTMGPTGPAFASLEMGVSGLPLPDLTKDSAKRAVHRYRHEAAQLLVFDAWIGNDDRHANIKAALISPHFHLFAGFDHGNALLGCAGSALASLNELSLRSSFVDRHPFVEFLRFIDVVSVLDELSRVPRARIVRACTPGPSIATVSPQVQNMLASTLLYRRRWLKRILRAVDFGG